MAGTPYRTSASTRLRRSGSLRTGPASVTLPSIIPDEDLIAPLFFSILWKVAVESGSKVEWTEEVNYKFRLSSFQDALIAWLEATPSGMFDSLPLFQSVGTG